MTLNRLLKNSQDFIYCDTDNFEIEHLYGSRYLIRNCNKCNKERKQPMGEIILIISITLILTVVSSFWLGYAYGKLRTIQSYQTNQKDIFIDYMSQGEKGEDIE